jgi:hypothetical protein
MTQLICARVHEYAKDIASCIEVELLAVAASEFFIHLHYRSVLGKDCLSDRRIATGAPNASGVFGCGREANQVSTRNKAQMVVRATSTNEPGEVVDPSSESKKDDDTNKSKAQMIEHGARMKSCSRESSLMTKRKIESSHSTLAVFGCQ